VDRVHWVYGSRWPNGGNWVYRFAGERLNGYGSDWIYRTLNNWPDGIYWHSRGDFYGYWTYWIYGVYRGVCYGIYRIHWVHWSGVYHNRTNWIYRSVYYRSNRIHWPFGDWLYGIHRIHGGGRCRLYRDRTDWIHRVHRGQLHGYWPNGIYRGRGFRLYCYRAYWVYWPQHHGCDRIHGVHRSVHHGSNWLHGNSRCGLNSDWANRVYRPKRYRLYWLYRLHWIYGGARLCLYRYGADGIYWA
jgi:hypothetical protein